MIDPEAFAAFKDEPPKGEHCAHVILTPGIEAELAANPEAETRQFAAAAYALIGEFMESAGRMERPRHFLAFQGAVALTLAALIESILTNHPEWPERKK